jgi:ABC-type branched-subunit amino acid transport system ATPase component
MEIVFIAGNNKNGKTTLLKAISGYIPKIEGYVKSGEVLISGLSLNSGISLLDTTNFNEVLNIFPF